MPLLLLAGLGLFLFAAANKKGGSSRTFVNNMPIDANAPADIVALVNQRISDVPFSEQGFIELSQLLAGTAAGLGPVYPLASAACWARLRELVAQFPQWSAPPAA